VPLLGIRFTNLYHNRQEEKTLKYSEFLANYTDVPQASKTLNDLLIKYDQQSNAAAFFLLFEDKGSFIKLPARVIGAVPSYVNYITNPMLLKYYQDYIQLSDVQIHDLEESTRGQSTSDRWSNARKLRISSKRFLSFVKYLFV
jgi:hypothetical protein